ncbi:YciI family protein [Thalassospira marina]|uniref:YCII-related domain-containing protein n=1 Tax=Thalassospira marina TaxID=2048283 RepID=A0A2N3KW43_9PROT|nr:YciI family protein [Thalassospira marina]AUG54755.1 hypothetical protein CSC3H3_20045 [Thalassospira marina]PKR54758.1 hypothetical protein COO20_08450 [Thalassospira marina]
MFIVNLTYLVDLNEIDAVLADHVEWLKQCYGTGAFVASGPKKPREGGVILARCTREKLEDCLKLDPFWDKGFARYDIIEFEPAMMASGFEKLLAK